MTLSIYILIIVSLPNLIKYSISFCSHTENIRKKQMALQHFLHKCSLEQENNHWW